MKAFLFDGNLIVNVVVVDEESSWTPPEHLTLMNVPDGCYAGIGWRLIDDEWVAPPPPPIVEDEQDEEDPFVI
jgi:hypothetical protein